MSAKWIAIVALVVVVVAAAAGYGGYSYGQTSGRQQATDARQRFLADRGGAAGAGGAQGFGGQNGNRQFNPDNFATGQVKTVTGDTVQLSTATSVVTIKLDGNTQIMKMTSGSP